MPKISLSRLLISVPTAALVAGAFAAPVVADPGNAPGGGNADDRAQTAHENRPPLPDQAKVPDHAAARDPQQVGPPPGRPRGRGADAPQAPAPQAPAPQAPAPQAPGAVPPVAAPGAGNGVDGAQGSKLGRVVICKWVRKPGVTEIPSHVIVVNANALVGKGFDGTFPFPFSDGQVNSMAIRWAEKGESAREIDDAACGTAPAGTVVDETSAPQGVLGVAATASDAADAAAQADPVSERAVASSADALPATGAQEHLRLLLALGGVATLLGALLMAGRLRRSTPGT